MKEGMKEERTKRGVDKKEKGPQNKRRVQMEKSRNKQNKRGQKTK
jgi:hypothetical protein